jgi:predicted MPP superfamily phosphohydrolase
LPSLSKIKLFGDNPYTYGNLPKALARVGHGTVILLTHNPVLWSREVIQKYPFVSLTLAGHTHAGQMGLYWKKYANQVAQYNEKTKAGLFRYNNQYLYINAGIGTSAIHSRFLILPEVTLITLRH